MSIQSVLVEYNDNNEKKVYGNSGCMFSGKYVITTSNVLITLILKQNNLNKKLASLQPGFLLPEKLLNCQPEINIVINHNPYVNQRGKVIGIYLSGDVRKQVPLFFNDWTVDVEDKATQLKEVLPLFLFIGICSNDAQSTISEDLFKCLRETFIGTISAFDVGDKVIIEGTSFGNRHFLRSRSSGIVSNTFGNRQTFILTDAPTAPGCEGSPIFLKAKSKKLVPIGIVLASLSWWKGEWIGLTLAVTFSRLFADILGEVSHTSSITQYPKLERIRYFLDFCLAQVISGPSWGTGILLNKENGIFITNSHVVDADNVILAWKNIEIKSKIIYKTPKDEVYDIAILLADTNTLRQTNMQAAIVSEDEINLGEKVFAAGFSLFPRSTQLEPTLSAGCISQIRPTMIKTTCSVLPGASGGAFINKYGKLIGIIVCNARHCANSSANPRINMGIPILNIIQIIRDYMSTKDILALERLKLEEWEPKKDWNFLNSSL